MENGNCLIDIGNRKWKKVWKRDDKDGGRRMKNG